MPLCTGPLTLLKIIVEQSSEMSVNINCNIHSQFQKTIIFLLTTGKLQISHKSRSFYFIAHFVLNMSKYFILKQMQIYVPITVAAQSKA
jgi:hypothetical protein